MARIPVRRDQQFDCVEVFLQCAAAAFITCFHEFMHESGGRGEGDALGFSGRRPAPVPGRCGFAGAGWPSAIGSSVASRSIRSGQFENQRFY